jgi:iron complex transport system permease protein
MAYNFTARQRYLLILLGLLVPFSVLFALINGSVDISINQLFNTLTGDENDLSRRIVLELRWPRVITAFAVGGLLALAGILMQVLLRNPLADPYVLGISGGAATAVLLAMLAGLGGVMLNLSAFGGALFSMILVFGTAQGRGSWTSARLLLSGVVIAFAWGALISFILAIAADQQLRSMLFWLMGDLSYSDNPLISVAVLVVCLIHYCHCRHPGWQYRFYRPGGTAYPATCHR